MIKIVEFPPCRRFQKLFQLLTLDKTFRSYPSLILSFHHLSFDPIPPSKVDLLPQIGNWIRTPNLPYFSIDSQPSMWLGVIFWRVIMPLCFCSEWSSSHAFRVIRGAYCGKKRTSQQLGGALLQDQHLFMVVTHSTYINTKSYLFSYM